MNQDAGAAAESSASRARDRDRLQPTSRGRKKKRPTRTGPIDPPYLVTAPPSALTPPPESDANLILPSTYVRSLNSPRPAMAARASNGSLPPNQHANGRQSYAANFLSPPTIMATTPSIPRPPPTRGGYAATLLSPPSIMPGGRPSEPLVQRPARHTRQGSHSDLRDMGAVSPIGSGDERDRDRDREGRASPNPRRRRRRVVQESIRRQRSQTVSSAEEGRAIGLSRGASMRRVNLWDDLPDQETVDGGDPPPPFPFPTASNVRAPPTFAGSLPPIPDSPPPSFDIALASPLPLHEPGSSPASAGAGPSSSPPSDPATSPQARRSLPAPPTESAEPADDTPSPTEASSSDEDVEVDTRVDRRQWNADILAGYTLEERVAREHARQQARTPVLEAEARRTEAERQAADERRKREEEEAQRREGEERRRQEEEETRRREEIIRREYETRRREEEEDAARRQQEVADRQAEEDARVLRREAEEAARRAESEAAAAAAAAATRAAEEEAHLKRREEEEAAKRKAAEEAERREAIAAALRQAEEEARAALAEAEAAARAAKAEAAAAKKREDEAARARRAEMAAAAMRRHEIEEALREAIATHPVSKADLQVARYKVVNELGGRPATRAEIAAAARAALGSKVLSKFADTATTPPPSDQLRAVTTPAAQQPLFSSPAFQHPITSPRRNDRDHEPTELLESPPQKDRGDPSPASTLRGASDPSPPDNEVRRASYPAMGSARGAPPDTGPSADAARPTPSRSSTAPTDSRDASVTSHADRGSGSRPSLNAGGSGPRSQDVPKDQQQRRLSGPRPNGKAVTPTSPRSSKIGTRDKIFSRLDPIASGSASRADTPAPPFSSALEEFGALPTRSPEATATSRLSMSGATPSDSRRHSSIASDGHPDPRSRSSSASGRTRSRSSSVSGPRPMPHSLPGGSDPRMSDAPPVPIVPVHLRTPSQTLAAFKFPPSAGPAKTTGTPELPTTDAQAPEPPTKPVLPGRGLTLSPVALTSALPVPGPVPNTSSLPPRSPAATSSLPPKEKEQEPIQPPKRSDSLNSNSSHAPSVSVRRSRPSNPSHWPPTESRSTTALSSRSTPSLSKSNTSVSASGVSSSTQSPVISVSQTPWDHRAVTPEVRQQVGDEGKDEDRPPPVPPKDHISPVPWAHTTSPLASKPDELPIVPMISAKADELPIVLMRSVEQPAPARPAPPAPPSAWRQVGGTWQRMPMGTESGPHTESSRHDAPQAITQETDSQPQQSALFHRLTLGRRGRSIDLLKQVLSPYESSSPDPSGAGDTLTAIPPSSRPPDAEVLQADDSKDTIADRGDAVSTPRPESVGLSTLMESSSALLSLLEQEQGAGESSAQGAARSALADEVRQQLEIEAAIRSERDRVDQASEDLALALSLDNRTEVDTTSDAALAAAIQAEDYAQKPPPAAALRGKEKAQWPALPSSNGKGKGRAPPPPTAPKPDRVIPPKPTRAPPLPPRHSNESPALTLREVAASSDPAPQEQDKDEVPPSKRDTQYMIASFPIPPVPSRNPATPSSPAPKLPPIRPSRPLSQFPPARASQFIQPDDAPPLPTPAVPPLPSNTPLPTTATPTLRGNGPGRDSPVQSTSPSRMRRVPPPPPRPASAVVDEAPLIQLDDDPSAVAQFKRHQALHSISSTSSSSLLDDISSAVGHHGHGFSPARNDRGHGEDSASSVSGASTTRSAWRSSTPTAGGTPVRRPGGPRTRRDPPPVPPRPWARDGPSPMSEPRSSTGLVTSSSPTSALATPTRLSVDRPTPQIPSSALGGTSPPSEGPAVSRTVSKEGMDRNRLSVDRPQMLRSGSSSSSMFAGLRLDAQGQLVDDATGRAASPLAAESSLASRPAPVSVADSISHPAAGGPLEQSSSQSRQPEPVGSESPAPPEQPTYAEITDVDLYASRVLGGDHEYEGLNHLINFIGPAKEPGATPEQLAYLSAAPVHVDSRRVNAAGKVKIKLSVLGVRVTNCPVCLAQYRSEDAAVLLPCGHVAHESCARRWFRESDGCMVCRTKLGEERGGSE